jgi:hypothetical protein
MSVDGKHGTRCNTDQVFLNCKSLFASKQLKTWIIHAGLPKRDAAKAAEEFAKVPRNKYYKQRHLKALATQQRYEDIDKVKAHTGNSPSCLTLVVEAVLLALSDSARYPGN